MSIVYNDNDPKVCEWLRALVGNDLIPEGRIDEADISEVSYGLEDQVHCFSGIGGWPLALELAGWESAQPVLTGSCPCQPFSSAGKRKGKEDERHLWPAMLGVVHDVQPPVIFGEQVAGADGRKWLAEVKRDLERLDYRFAAADLPAAMVDSPHIRQRLYWCAIEKGYELELRPTNALPDPWGEFVVLPCRDGKFRRAGVPPVAPKIAGRVAMLSGLGNAIVPQLAELFIRAMVAVSKEASLQGALTAYLLETVDVNASLECRLRWKGVKVGDAVIPRLSATARKVPWTTPQAHDAVGAGNAERLLRHGTKHGCRNLNDLVQLATWPMASQLVTWPTCTAMDGRRGSEDSMPHDSGVPLSQAAMLTVWGTPRANNGRSSGASHVNDETPKSRLENQVTGALNPWATSARDWKDTPGMATNGVNPDGSERRRFDQLPRQVPGDGKLMLSPGFSSWLMGFSPHWLAAYLEAISV